MFTPTPRRSGLRILVIFPAILALFAGMAVRAEPPPLVERLPGTTMVYLGWSPNAAMQETRPAKMLADEQFIGPWRGLLQRLLLDLIDAENPREKLPDDWTAMLADIAQCQGAFALLDWQPARANGSTAQAALIINLGARRKSFEKSFQPVHTRLKGRLGGTVQMMKLQGSWLWLKPDAMERPIYVWGFVGDRFVIYWGDQAERFLPTLIDNSQPLANPLASSPGFTNAMQALADPPRDSILTTYMDAPRALEALRKALTRDSSLKQWSPFWPSLIKQIGLDNVQAVAESTSIVEGNFVTRTLLRTDSPPHGLLAAMINPPVDESFLQCIPSDAMVAAAVRMDPVKVYEQLKAAAEGIAGAAATGAFNAIEKSAADLGVGTRDVLAPLGDQWAIYNSASTGGWFFTGWTLVASVRDADRLDRTLETTRQLLAELFGDSGQIEIREIDGVRIHTLLQNEGWSVMAPSWAAIDGHLVVGLYPQTVQDAVRQIRGGANITGNPQFAAARGRIGVDGPFVQISGPELIRNLYPMGLPLMTFVLNQGRRESDFGWPTHPLMMPSARTLMDYSGISAVTARQTDKGILRIKTQGNPLLSPLTLDSPALWLAVMAPIDAMEVEAMRPTIPTTGPATAPARPIDEP